MDTNAISNGTRNLIDIVSSTSFTVLTRLHNATLYSIDCEADLTNSTDTILTHNLKYTISGENQTHLVIQGLLPATSYNCCVSDFVSEPECAVETTNASGLSPIAAGALGGFLGALLTVIIALTVVTIVVVSLVVVKRKRAITRAKVRPVLRTDSTRYKRPNTIPNTPSTIFPSPTHVTPSHPSPTKPPAKSLPAAPHKSTNKSVRKISGEKLKPITPLKPPVPLKPPIQKNTPVGQTRAQLDANGFPDDEHIYDDVEGIQCNLGSGTKRIVSRENVAYTGPDGEIPEEYDELY